MADYTFVDSISGKTFRLRDFASIFTREATLPYDTNVWASQATVNAYAVLGTPWSKQHLKSGTIVIRNTGANGAHVKVDASFDGVNYFTVILAETVVGAGTNLVVSLTTYYPYVQIQIKAQVAASQTTVEAHAGAIQT